MSYFTMKLYLKIWYSYQIFFFIVLNKKKNDNRKTWSFSKWTHPWIHWNNPFSVIIDITRSRSKIIARFSCVNLQKCSRWQRIFAYFSIRRRPIWHKVAILENFKVNIANLGICCDIYSSGTNTILEKKVFIILT